MDLVCQQGNNADLARVKELLSLDAGVNGHLKNRTFGHGNSAIVAR